MYIRRLRSHRKLYIDVAAVYVNIRPASQSASHQPDSRSLQFKSSKCGWRGSRVFHPLYRIHRQRCARQKFRAIALIIITSSFLCLFSGTANSFRYHRIAPSSSLVLCDDAVPCFFADTVSIWQSTFVAMYLFHDILEGLLEYL